MRFPNINLINRHCKNLQVLGQAGIVFHSHEEIVQVPPDLAAQDTEMKDIFEHVRISDSVFRLDGL
ncbi:uncharacterized protein BDR25DRAFT_356370 [Lindgomyces ingoldianus]|uniref:Uncharacterized protein n=1 Tax=Lindgomyces ingoldianus TaxID=673940 RepID=A0ACB6QRN0_9PLEO|nr:uncharacterized protein BDR25DRAFT_356370 [Lindgomyces ingoldianus]KAF2469633.1 hypothetical protein BDR25DRAFT_356370 [Lindgomyces ingoldianus]